MSKNIPTVKRNKKDNGFVVQGVQLLYPKHKGYGELKHEQVADPELPAKNMEYGVNIVINKAVLKELRTVAKKKKPDEITKEDFEAKYKMAPIFEDDNDEYYVVKFTRRADKKDGTPNAEFFIPKILNSKREDLKECSINNGAVGDVILLDNIFNSAKGQVSSLQLSAIMYKEYEEYVSDALDVEDEFDFDEYDDDFDEPTTEGKSSSGDDDQDGWQ